MNDFYNASVWEKAWKDDSDTIVYMMRRAGIDPVRSFDHKAKTFNEQSCR